MTRAASIVAFVPDLMDRSRFGALDVDFVRSLDDLAPHGAKTVVIDLGRDGAIGVMAELSGRRIIGFASHVDTELIEAARTAGCGEVLPRSRFFARLGEILGGDAPTDTD